MPAVKKKAFQGAVEDAKVTPPNLTNPLEGLAKAWEKNDQLRSDALDSRSLVQWPSPSLVGIISMKALMLNVDLLYEAARIWAPTKSKPKTLPVEWVKKEAG